MKKYHIVYKTTNKVNNKIYVGLHSTNKLNDSYLGSGYVLKVAILKYGRNNFTKEILYVFKERADARTMEASIVDSEFVDRKDTYNIALGGMGVEDQSGPKNHMYGKVAHNAKKLKATHVDGTILTSNSIKDMSSLININRANIRALIRKGNIGYRGWSVEHLED